MNHHIQEFFANFTKSVTQERLKRYRPAGEADLTVAATYFWNVQLCEALYPSLHSVEVVIRNAVHATLTDRFGRDDWYHVPQLLQRNEASAIQAAETTIKQSKKQLTPDRVIAGVTFGFWTSIFQSPYGQKPTSSQIWGPANNSLLPKVFPFAPNPTRTKRKDICARLDEIRKLRNRAYHCECIFDDPELLEKHQRILEVIGWINPSVSHAVIGFDRFDAVYQSGASAAERTLCEKLLQR